MTNAELIKYVRTRLGDPVIDVELDDIQIQKAIDEALRLWGQHMPTEKIMSIQIVAGIQGYDLSGVPGLRGITQINEEPIDFNSSVEFDIFRDRVWHLPVPNVTDIALDTMYLNTLRYVGSTMFDWRYEEVTKMLYVTPIPSRSYNAFTCYTVSPTLEEATSKYNWVVEMTLALAKETLGYIRRKHGDKVPGRELEVPLDGAALISESREAVKDLMDKLDGVGGDWLPPLRA